MNQFSVYDYETSPFQMRLHLLKAILTVLAGAVALVLFMNVWNHASEDASVTVVSPPKREGKAIAVFVALCDNEHQGIAPVPVKIGKGDDPEGNLYWGCSDGLPKVFAKKGLWSSTGKKEDQEGPVLRTYTYKHKSKKAELTAFAYKGDSIKTCMEDFEKALVSGKYDVVAFIGHNGLMDVTLASPPPGKPGPVAASIILCCKSRDYFTPRLQAMGSRPLLLTRQNMYPGGFILHDALEQYLDGKDRAAMRQAAAKAYAANQKISVKAALGVFADLEG